MNEYYCAFLEPTVYDLQHHGIKGMKWGIRRWQNGDGSYNAAGRARYGFGDGKTYSGVKSNGSVKASTATRTKRSGSSTNKKGSTTGKRVTDKDLGTLRKRMNDLQDRDYATAKKSGKDYKPSKEYTKALNDYNKAVDSYKPEKKKLTTKQKVAIGVGVAAATAVTVAVAKRQHDKRSAKETFDKLSSETYGIGKDLGAKYNGDVARGTTSVGDLIKKGKYREATKVGQDFLHNSGYKYDAIEAKRKDREMAWMLYDEAKKSGNSIDPDILNLIKN